MWETYTRLSELFQLGVDAILQIIDFWRSIGFVVDFPGVEGSAMWFSAFDFIITFFIVDFVILRFFFDEDAMEV